jgi:hypothetical protein
MNNNNEMIYILYGKNILVAHDSPIYPVQMEWNDIKEVEA